MLSGDGDTEWRAVTVDSSKKDSKNMLEGYYPGSPLRQNRPVCRLLKTERLGEVLTRVDEITSIVGPVERDNAQLVLRIPLAIGGAELSKYAHGIGDVQGDFLVVTILPWLADKLGLSEGSVVTVDNADGKFNIRPQTGA